MSSITAASRVVRVTEGAWLWPGCDSIGAEPTHGRDSGLPFIVMTKAGPQHRKSKLKGAEEPKKAKRKVKAGPRL